jgi:hypothetical protein
METKNKEMYDAAVDNLVEGIHVDYTKWCGGKEFKDVIITINQGRKFLKIIRNNSVWGFVAKTDGMLKGIPYFVGDVFKAAGWSAPAKHVRGSIFDSNQDWFQWTGPNYR